MTAPRLAEAAERTRAVVSIIQPGIATVAVAAVATADEVAIFVVAEPGARVEVIRFPAPPEASASVDALRSFAGTLHGSPAPIAELAISGSAGRAFSFAIGRLRSALFASGGGFQTLFQLGTVALELLLELVTVSSDRVAHGTLARTGIGATARSDGAAFLHIVRVALIQLSKRFCRTSHRGGRRRG